MAADTFRCGPEGGEVKVAATLGAVVLSCLGCPQLEKLWHWSVFFFFFFSGCRMLQVGTDIAYHLGRVLLSYAT